MQVSCLPNSCSVGAGVGILVGFWACRRGEEGGVGVGWEERMEGMLCWCIEGMGSTVAKMCWRSGWACGGFPEFGIGMDGWMDGLRKGIKEVGKLVMDIIHRE